MRVGEMALARARTGRAPVNPFSLPQFPPSAAPPVTMAQDDAIGSSLAWAAGGLGPGFAEGVAFFGYPLLAELAQRPEYRRISETIATEMTRKWIKIQATGDEDKADKIARINAAMDRLRVRDVFRRVAEQDGFFGRSHVYLDLGTTDDPEELRTPIGDGRNGTSQTKVAKGALKGLRVIEAVWCYPNAFNTRNPLEPDWYTPSTWYVQGRPIHSTRLLTFVGREVPDLLKPAYSFGGLSMSQMAKPYVDNWIRTRQSVADLLSSFSVSGIKTNLAEGLQADGDGLFKRVDLFNAMRDNRGAMVLNTDEEFFNVSTPLGTLDALQAQSQEHMASVSAIPLVVFTGITPSGLNASSDGEIRVWKDWIHSYQEKLFTDNLRRVLGFIQLSELGEVDPDITFTYEPLWTLDETQKAEVQRVEAETDRILIDASVISPQDARRRVAADPEAAHAGLDLDVAPALSEIGKADVASKRADAITTAFEAGLIDRATALREMVATGLFTEITPEDIAEAESDLPPITEADPPSVA